MFFSNDCLRRVFGVLGERRVVIVSDVSCVVCVFFFFKGEKRGREREILNGDFV